MWWTWLIILLAGLLAYRWWELKRKIYSKPEEDFKRSTPTYTESGTYSDEIIDRMLQLTKETEKEKNPPKHQQPDVPGAVSAAPMDSVAQRQASTTENPIEIQIQQLDFENYDLKFNPTASVVYNNKDRYIGEKDAEGFRHGIGKYYYFSNKSVYLGQWIKGKRTGYGILKWQNGDLYKGYWDNGQLHGYGVYHFSIGDIYKGRWDNGTKDGYGNYDFNNGDRYEGNWVQDLRTGFGTYYYANGDRYVGNFLDNKFQGAGKYTYADGRVQEGEWSDGQFLD